MCKIATLTKNNVTFALEIKEIDNETHIVNRNYTKPALFVDFPLIGSEKFPTPAFINSHFFNPNEPRSSIQLHKEHSALHNKSLFESVVHLHKKFIQHAIMLNWKNLHYLSISDIPKENNIDTDWYKFSIQHPLRNYIANSEIVYTHSNTYI